MKGDANGVAMESVPVRAIDYVTGKDDAIDHSRAIPLVISL